MGAPGFDDAPRVVVGTAVAKPITMIYPYYENPQFFLRQLEFWAAYPVEVRKFLSAIVVDDGSPRAPARDVLRGAHLPFPIRLFRIAVDVRWNWLAARNIGAHHAASGWLVLTDMDHVLPVATAARLVYGAHDPGTIYRFSRKEQTGVAIHPHPNSMFMTREVFWKVGGYDEALSGFYGTDGDWRRRCAATAPVLTLSEELIRYEHTGDSSTTHYLRKQPMDAAKKRIIANRKPGWRPMTLTFPYSEEVA